MFEIRKSIKRFRDDPAWTYRKHAREYLSTFDRGGYPFSLGPDGLAIRNLLQGSFRGREVSLCHLLAWQRGAKANVAWTYSVAVLRLPRAPSHCLDEPPIGSVPSGGNPVPRSIASPGPQETCPTSAPT